MQNLFNKSRVMLSRLTSSSPSMLSLGNTKVLLQTLRKYAWKLISISTGKVKVTPRLRRFNNFLSAVIKHYNHHGALSTVKWLKAAHMAIQRKISSQPFTSLRDLEPDFPFPRLINGLPSFIGSMDRKAIRSGHPGTIRLWLTILNIYRVLKAPVKLNLATITDKYSGTQEGLSKAKEDIKTIYNWFGPSLKYRKDISAKEIHRTVASGPNVGISITGILTDAIALAKYPEVYEPYRDYCLLTKSGILNMLNLSIDWCFNNLTKYGNSWVKLAKSVSDFDNIALGKLAFKEEAAGKLRVFAIVDIWTQSLFKPLHNSLFELLKNLPNDGTFDQDLSFKRSLTKAKRYNCAYSVDLSSATDRLPLELQTLIIDLLYKEGVGKLWGKILVERPFFIRKDAYGMKANDYVYYGTGQPMGCLSSWAMLAVCHHFLVQVCAYRVYGVELHSWFTKYEILGDDLVLFDKLVYEEYINLMKSLGVGINLSKSLISEQLTSFEFAKRTGIDGIDVSGLSWKQLITEDSITGRVSFTLSMIRKGIILSPAMLVKALSGTHHMKFQEIFQDSKLSELYQGMIFGLLGSFVNSNKIPLKSAVALLVDPHDEDMEYLDKPKVPITSTLQYVLALANSEIPLDPPISDLKSRLKDAQREVIPYMGDTLVREALAQITLFKDEYDKLLNLHAISLVDPGIFKDSDGNIDRIALSQLTSFAEWTLLKDRDPQDLFDEVYNYVANIKVDLPPIKEAMEISEKVSSFISYMDIEPIAKTAKGTEVSWLYKDITHAGKLKGTPYWKLLDRM